MAADPGASVCTAACADDVHAADCPFECNLWPVTEEDLGPRPLICFLCRAPFTDDEYYTTVPSGAENVRGIPGAVTVICLGCAALNRRPAV